MTPAEEPGSRREDPAVGKLLRWYPRQWRERYGEEFLAMVEDTLDGRRPTMRLRLSVAWGGLRERGRQAAVDWKEAAKRHDVYGRRWMIYVIGFFVTTLPADFRASLPPGRAWQATAALGALAAFAVFIGAAVVAGGLAALPAMVRFLRGGGWRTIRRRVAWAAGATAVAGGMLTGLVLASCSQTFAQLNESWAYLLGVIVTSLALMVAIGLWISAAVAAARHLHLSPRVRAAQMMLGAVTSIAVSVMLAVNIIWWSAIQSSVLLLLLGTTGLAVLLPAATTKMRRAVRSGRRLRRTVTR